MKHMFINGTREKTFKEFPSLVTYKRSIQRPRIVLIPVTGVSKSSETSITKLLEGEYLRERKRGCLSRGIYTGLTVLSRMTINPTTCTTGALWGPTPVL